MPEASGAFAVAAKVGKARPQGAKASRHVPPVLALDYGQGCATMKTATPAMIALLASATELFMPELFTFTLIDGTVLRYTSGDRDIEYAANLYLSGPVLVERSNVKWETGLEVDVIVLTIMADGEDLIAVTPLLQAIAAGTFDDANVVVNRLYTETWGDWTAGDVNIFTGNVSNIVEIGRSHAKLEVKSRLEKLNQPMPRNIYQAACQWTLFDAGCTLNAADFDIAGIVASGSDKLTIKSNLANADDYFNLGVVVFTSGQNDGQSRVVRSYTLADGKLTLYIPLPFTPAAADTFTAYPGCDKLQATCDTKFSNIANFGGEPYIPVPESAI